MISGRTSFIPPSFWAVGLLPGVFVDLTLLFLKRMFNAELVDMRQGRQEQALFGDTCAS